jgi:serine/threonine protein kinase/Flp pilus assembly protein TadD
MSAASKDSNPLPLPLEMGLRVNAACNAFELALQAGQRPRVEDYLGDTREPERSALRKELTALERDYRAASGETAPRDSAGVVATPPAAQVHQSAPASEDRPTLAPGLLAGADPALGLAEAVKTGEAHPQGPTPAAPPNLPVADESVPASRTNSIPNQLGEYRILREIGRGGMGVVYEAVQESLGRHVALKVLPFAGLLGPTHLERFRREARAAAKLHHTNIVPVFAVGAHAGVHYYAMQYIHGRGLDQVLREVRLLRSDRQAAPVEARDLAAHVAASLVTGRFARPLPANQNGSSEGMVQHPPRLTAPPSEGSRLANGGEVPLSSARSDTDLSGRSSTEYFRRVARLGVQVAEGLAYAHHQGILHRDIKPSNLLLDTAGTIWITDFGLAKAEDGAELTSPGDIVGTLRYMAPERFDGHAAPYSDVYSLGLTLYEMLTLRPAFDDSDRPRLIDRARHETPPAPRQIDARIPRDLETIVLKAMAREPGDRYATAELLAEDLRLFLADRPILARRSSLIEQAWRWGRRNPALAALLATLLFLLMGGISTALWYVQDRAQRAAALAVRKAHIEQEIEIAVQEANMLGERAWELTETPHLWEATLASALSAIRRAEALAADAGDLVGAELHERVRNRKADLEVDERDRQMVAVLEQIWLEKGQVDVRKNRFTSATAVPKYVEVFRRYGLELGSAPVDRTAELIRGKRAPVRSAIVAALDHWFMREATPDEQRDWLRTVITAADTDEWRTKVLTAAVRHERETLEQLVDEVAVAKQPPAALILLKNALLREGGEKSAVRLLRRAQQQFPGDFWINHELGTVLLNARPPRPDEAVTYFRIAVALRPHNCGVHLNLGFALNKRGDLPGAIAAYQKAIDLNPGYAAAYNNLGNALRHKGDLAGAMAALQKALDLDPDYAGAHYNMGGVLHAQGDVHGAIASCQKAIGLDPQLAGPHHLLGIALFDLGDLPGAVAALQKAIDLNADFAEAHCNLGQALRSQAKFTESLAALQRGHGLGTRQNGWRYPSAQWVREAERLVELDRKLPAIRSGQEKPETAAERIEYAQLCGYKRHYAAGVRFYQEAFASQPALADNVRSEHRYNAACLAARAGTTPGEDADAQTESQHADVRKQAHDWLRADLAAWTKLLNRGESHDRSLVQRTLQHWQRDRDLAALRDEAALAKLPAPEQMAWQQFWAEVAARLDSLSAR